MVLQQRVIHGRRQQVFCLTVDRDEAVHAGDPVPPEDQPGIPWGGRKSDWLLASIIFTEAQNGTEIIPGLVPINGQAQL